MKTWYVLPEQTDAVNPPTEYVTRASELGLELIIGDPSLKVTVYPSILVMSNATDPAVFPDDEKQVNLSEIQAAQQAAITAEQSAVDAKTNALTQAYQKLAALGLTPEEIAAITGNN